MDMLDTLIGGALAIGASVAAQYAQLRYTRKVKMDEAIAARKVTANAEAYRNIKRIEGAFVQKSVEETSKMAAELEQWFFDNLLFLPGEFPDHWLTVRTNLRLLAMKVGSRPLEVTTALEHKVEKAISAAIGEVYKDAGMTRPEWDRRGAVAE